MGGGGVKANFAVEVCDPVDIPAYLERADLAVVAVMKKSIYIDILETLKDIGVDESVIIWAQPESAKGRCYGEYGEGIIAWSIFKILGINKPTYLNVGVSSPVGGNNAFLFYQNGSRGINIEANPKFIEDIENILQGDVTLNIAIGTEEGTMPFYIVNQLSGLSSLKPTWAEAWKNEHDGTCSVIDVKVTTLNTIVRDYCDGIWPQYLSIDVEGMDYDALSVSDLTNGPLVIVAETLSVDVYRSMGAMLREKGYVPYARTVSNTIFVRRDAWERVLGAGELNH